MSYNDYDYDFTAYIVEKFLSNHKVGELLKIITDVLYPTTKLDKQCKECSTFDLYDSCEGCSKWTERFKG